MFYDLHSRLSSRQANTPRISKQTSIQTVPPPPLQNFYGNIALNDRAQGRHSNLSSHQDFPRVSKQIPFVTIADTATAAFVSRSVLEFKYPTGKYPASFQAKLHSMFLQLPFQIITVIPRLITVSIADTDTVGCFFQSVLRLKQLPEKYPANFQPNSI